MEPLREFRCPHCGRLLAKFRFGDRRGTVQVKCQRCGRIAETGADAWPPEARAAAPPRP